MWEKEQCKPKKKRKSPNEKKTLRKHCDDLWSLIIRERDGCCRAGELLGETCGGPLNAHHIEGRYLNVRWDLENGIALCSKHHTMGRTAAHATASSGQREFQSKVMVEIYGTEKLEKLKQKARINKSWGLVELRELKEKLTKIYNGMI